jgi:hypothetical protein
MCDNLSLFTSIKYQCPQPAQLPPEHDPQEGEELPARAFPPLSE